MHKLRAALEGTDWALLADQKAALVEAIALIENVDPDGEQYPTHIERLDQLLLWIHAIQESAQADGFPVVNLYSSNSKPTQ